MWRLHSRRLSVGSVNTLQDAVLSWRIWWLLLILLVLLPLLFRTSIRRPQLQALLDVQSGGWSLSGTAGRDAVVLIESFRCLV